MFLVEDFDDLPSAQRFIEKRYGDRISSSGADQVDIVNLNGDIVEQFKVC